MTAPICIWCVLEQTGSRTRNRRNQRRQTAVSRRIEHAGDTKTGVAQRKPTATVCLSELRSRTGIA